VAAVGRTGDYVTLAKPGLNMLVIGTTLAGYYMAAPHGFWSWHLLNTLIGTALVAGGASAFNQLLEIEADGLMRRTRARPLPSGRVHPRWARLFALALSAAGLVELAVAVNPLSAAVALATLLTYAVFYTPLKRRTSLATIGGAASAEPGADGCRADRKCVWSRGGSSGRCVPGAVDQIRVAEEHAERAAVLLRVYPVPAADVDPDGDRPGDGMSVSDLPALNATLNAVAALFLAAGYFFIRRRDRRAHRACMLPIWLYVSVTGVVVYVMLYRLS
jgi:hypothetical protein